MYAVIELGGFQVRVGKNDRFKVNRIKSARSKTLKADKVLFGKKGSSYFIGEPYLKNAYVECEILGDSRSGKLVAFKYRERKGSQSKKGHRQDITELKVKEIHFARTPKKKEEKRDGT